MTRNSSGMPVNPRTTPLGFAWFLALGIALAILCWPAPSLAQEAKPGGSPQDYAASLAQAYEELETGKTAEARKRLESTVKALRSFEYEYLLARAQAAPGGAAAPALIRTIATPSVECRYGVLNKVDLQLVYICRDGTLRIHDLNVPENPAKTVPSGDRGAIWSGAFSEDGKVFGSGHENGEVVLWDAKTWKIRQAVSLGEKWPVRELALAPDGTSFVAESKKELELWSVAGDAPKKIAGVGERYNFGEGLAFSPKGDLLATGGMFDIVIHDARTGEKTRSMRHASYTMGLEFSPDGKRIASAPRGNVNKFLSVFDIAEGKSLFIAGPFPQYVAGLAFTPDNKRVVATGPQNDVRFFDTTTGTVTLTIKRGGPTAKPVVSHDGRLVGWSEPAGYQYIRIPEQGGKAR